MGQAMNVMQPFLSLSKKAADVALSPITEAKKTRQAMEEQAAAERQRLAALEAKPVPALPTSGVARNAARASITAQIRRRGRESTILSPSLGSQVTGDTLGGS